MKKFSKILIVVMFLIMSLGLGTEVNAITIQIDTIDYNDKYIVNSESEFISKVNEIEEIVGLWVYVNPDEIFDLSIVETINNIENITYINIYPSCGVEEGFSLSNYEIDNLQSIKHLKNLNNIHLYGVNNLEDLSQFSGLENLYSLHINTSSLNSLTGIEKLQNLGVLGLSYVKVSDLSLLSNVKGLVELQLDDLPVSNIDSVSSLNNLQALYLSSLNIDNIDIENIKDLTNLEYLHLSNINIDNIDAIKGLTNLKHLLLELLQVSNIESIKDLKDLRVLILNNLPIQSIEVLEGMDNLTSLTLTRTRVYDINVLQELQSLYDIKLFQDYIDIDSLSDNLKSKIDFSNFVLKAEEQKKLHTDLEKITVRKGQEIHFKDLALDIVVLSREGLLSLKVKEGLLKDWEKEEFEQVMETLTIKSSDENILRVDNERKILIAEKDGEVEITATLFGLEKDAATLTTKIEVIVEVSSSAKPFVSTDLEGTKENNGLDNMLLIILILILILLCLLLLYLLNSKKYIISLVDKQKGSIVRRIRVKDEKEILIELYKEELGNVDIIIENNVAKSLADCILFVTYKSNILHKEQINQKNITEGLLYIKLD